MKSLISILIFTLNITFLLGNNNSYTLNFNPEAYTINSFNYENKEYKVRCFENIIYVKNPVDTMYQVLNIYVPEEYYHNKKIRNYSKKSAPIFLPNGIGGYMPSKPLTLLNKKTRNNRGPEPILHILNILLFLEMGFTFSWLLPISLNL